MHIAHIITRLVAGGAQRNTLLCAENQVNRGYQVTVVAGLETGPEGSLLDEARAGAYRFLELPNLVREVNPVKDLLALMQLIQWLRSQSVDILHTHTSKAGMLGRLAGAICRVPVVLHTPHGHVFHSYFSPLKTGIFKVCEGFLGHFCSDALVMLSTGCLRDHLQERIAPPSSLYVIPSGVPLDAYLKLDRKTGGGPPVIGYVGRLADIKGPLDLVQAMAVVATEISDARLLMVGDGPLRDQVESEIGRLGLESRIKITGWEEDTRPHLEEMDVLVVPSHNEGMGRVVVEAMAAGLPVVASRVGGLPDLVQDQVNGLLVTPKQPQQLAGAILTVLRNPTLARAWGENGRKQAVNFTDEVMFERIEALCQKLLGPRKTSATRGAF